MWNEPTSRFNPNCNYFTYLFQQSYRVEIVDDYADILIYSIYGEPPAGKHAKKFIYFPNEVSGPLYERAKLQRFEQYADAILTCNPIKANDIYFGHFIIYVNWWKYSCSLYMPQGTSPGYLVDLDTVNRGYSNKELAYRTLGCASFINNPAWPRQEIIEALCKWIPIHSYGRLGNNTHGPFGGDEYDKILETSLYTHSLAIENTIVNGYCSEKLIHCLASGSIPIYWGDYSKFSRYFNEELIVYVSQENLEGDALLEHIRKRTKEIMLLSRKCFFPHNPLRIDQIYEDFGPKIIMDKIRDRLNL
jgi:hypothetical protein